jgi:hypothetical protein
VVAAIVTRRAEALLSLAPESMAAILQVSGVDPHLTEHIARSLLLSSRYYAEAGNDDMAALRSNQARALAAAFGHELPSEAMTKSHPPFSQAWK